MANEVQRKPKPLRCWFQRDHATSPKGQQVNIKVSAGLRDVKST
ncbi:MAG: hypothetical protein ACTS6A_01715 [Candidatus Hodgkinia cicadicola]